MNVYESISMNLLSEKNGVFQPWTRLTCLHERRRSSSLMNTLVRLVPLVRVTSRPCCLHTPSLYHRFQSVAMAGSRSRQEPDPDFEIMVEDASASTSETASLVDSPSSSTSPPVSVVDDDPTETTETQTSQKRKKNPLVAGRGGLKKQSTRVQKQKGSTTDIKNPAAAVATAAATTTDIEEVVFSPSELEGMQGALLSWYDENHRVLPWRRNAHSRRSPAAVAAEPYQAPPGDLSDDVFIYYVWVCEIMSQQTQVSRVCEYFTRWVKKWPTVGDLARASQEELNEAWAGLGYYRRGQVSAGRGQVCGGGDGGHVSEDGGGAEEDTWCWAVHEPGDRVPGVWGAGGGGGRQRGQGAVEAAADRGGSQVGADGQVVCRRGR